MIIANSKVHESRGSLTVHKSYQVIFSYSRYIYKEREQQKYEQAERAGSWLFTKIDQMRLLFLFFICIIILIIFI